jgi:hypothetical protein
MPAGVDFASISLTKPGSLAQAATRDKYILKARGSAGILDWHPEPAKRLLYRQLSLRMRLIRFTAFKSVVFDIECNLDRLVEKLAPAQASTALSIPAALSRRIRTSAR